MAANNNNSVGMYNLAEMLYQGDGICEDKQTAAQYYIKAAQNGHVEAQVKYGKMILKSDGIAYSFDEAEKYFHMAVQNKSADAIYYYSKLLEKKYKEKHDCLYAKENEEVMDLIKKAADAGCIKACYKYGFCLENGFGIKENRTEAAKCYKIAADEGHGKAMYEYGYLLYYGYRIPENKKEGIDYIKKGADEGSTEGQFFMGSSYLKGNGSPLDVNKAAKYYHYNSLKFLCEILRNGQIEFDTRVHLKYYEMIANREYCYGYDVGLIKYFGKGYEKVDKREAARWFRNMADHYYHPSLCFYNNMLLRGDGIPQDLKEAANYYQMMVKCGCYDKEGSPNYTSMLYEGAIVPMDKEKASFLFKKAADLGNNVAMYAYGKMKYEGDGVPKNIDEGIKYLEMAAKTDLNIQNIFLYFHSIFFSYSLNFLSIFFVSTITSLKVVYDYIIQFLLFKRLTKNFSLNVLI